jgi:hypothetical protein
MNTKARLWSALVGFVVATAMVLGLSTSPAHAHFVSIYHGSDNAWTWNDDHSVTVYDLENDGNSVWVEVELTRTPYFDTVWDNYGGGGASRTWAGYINVFRLCEVGGGCTAWTVA